jgi:hypothetical protein
METHAKQTQFGPTGKWANAQNEANLAYRALWHRHPADDPWAGWGPQTRFIAFGNPCPCQRFGEMADCAKQSQFPAMPGGMGPCRPGAVGVVQTKPISGRTERDERGKIAGAADQGNYAKQSQFRPSSRTGKCLAGNELWRIEHATDLCETKPICRGPTGRDAGPGPEVRPPGGTSVQNKANFVPTDGNSQPVDRPEDAAAGGSELCKTKPICSAAMRPRRSSPGTRTPRPDGLRPSGG